jgi:hypothetical protein
VVAPLLIGRERELAALSAMVGERGLRLVTVTGPAGVGKTRVADAVADSVAQDSSWRVVRVDLAPLADAALVADAIAVAVERRFGRAAARPCAPPPTPWGSSERCWSSTTSSISGRLPPTSPRCWLRAPASPRS